MNTQLGHFLDHPLALIIEATHALTRRRVFHETQPIPDQPPEIELVIENPSATAPVP